MKTKPAVPRTNRCLNARSSPALGATISQMMAAMTFVARPFGIGSTCTNWLIGAPQPAPDSLRTVIGAEASTSDRDAPAPDIRRARRGTSAVFAVHGCVTGSFAARIPWIASHVGVGVGHLGIALLMPGIGALLAMPFSGRLAPPLRAAPVRHRRDRCVRGVPRPAGAADISSCCSAPSCSSPARSRDSRTWR